VTVTARALHHLALIAGPQWSLSFVSTRQFRGIDIRPFAVEVARGHD
jgi:hypothetical protein